ncbi:MAG: hypothetical protein H7210_06930, partial [Pyrinomonadaceae bacterium]|nr:hypothetical protein [Phycisphaerales bacterium]
MINPAPTSRIDPTLARGTLLEVIAATATRPGYVNITFPNTSYELHLLPGAPVSALVGKRIIGTIRAKARRVDKVQTGGRYVEPVYGRPRRVQGSVIATNEGAKTIVVDAGVPIECSLTDERQKTGQFAVGDFVSF